MCLEFSSEIEHCPFGEDFCHLLTSFLNALAFYGKFGLHQDFFIKKVKLRMMCEPVPYSSCVASTKPIS